MSIYGDGPSGVLLRALHAILASVWFWLAVLTLMVLGAWKVVDLLSSLFR